MKIPAWQRRPGTRDKADTLLLLGACALVLAPHALHLPFWIWLICSCALLWRALITLSGQRLPPLALLLPIALASMALVFAEYHTLLGRNAGVAMLVLLLTFKLLEMRARRDLHVVVLLGFFILLTQFFYSQSVATGLLTLVSVTLLLTAQLSFQYTGAMPPLRQRVGLAARIVALAAPVALVLFVLFPRIQGPLWGMPSDSQNARTGLSSHMEPGGVAELARSNELAFRVRFSGAVPAALYWRAVVLSDFDGRSWTRRAQPVPARPLTLQASGAPLPYQITQEASSERWLFALEMPRSLPAPGGVPADVSPELEMLAAAPLNGRMRYDVVSQPGYRFQVHESFELLQANLRLPARFNPRSLALAQALRRDGGDDDGVITRALAQFRRAPFRYTLHPPPLGRDAVDDFLFETRAGFCEHYAGAFVVLMRGAGIPARVVTGYQGGERNPVDGILTVRQSDAHAWAEVWLAQRGWVRIDPTAYVAPERVERELPDGLGAAEAGAAGWWQAARYNLAALDHAWSQWVLDYTPQRQQQLMRQWGAPRALAIGTGVLLAVFGLLLVLPLLTGKPPQARLDALYRRFCAAMARRGLARAAHEGPLDYRARLLAAPGPAARKQAQQAFLTLYAMQKYGLPKAQSRPESEVRLFGRRRHVAAERALALKQLKILLTQCK